jgi:hypothetical protein
VRLAHPLFHNLLDLNLFVRMTEAVHLGSPELIRTHLLLLEVAVGVNYEMKTNTIKKVD